MINYTDKHISQKQVNSMEDLKEKWASYLNILNSMYLIFESEFLKSEKPSYFNIHEITTRDAISTTYKNGEFKSQS